MSRSSTVVLVLGAVIAVIVYVELRRAGPTALPPVTNDAEIRDIVARVEALESAQGRRPAGPPPSGGAPVAGGTPESIEDATETGTVKAPPEKAAEDPKAAAVRIRELLARLPSGSVQPEEFDELWEVLPGSGLSPEAVEAFKKYVEAHPGDPDAHYGLGIALTSSFLGSHASQMETAVLSSQADQAFTKALELDDQHFGARFSKAFSYTFWPAFAGKSPEAIKHFEVLVDRHGSDRTNPMMRQVYLSLGAEYQKVGNTVKAKAAFRQGLTVFPDAEKLQEALDVMD